MLKVLADENFPGTALRGLQRLKPEFDIVRIQDVGLRSEDDPTLLEWAAKNGRILLSLDLSTVPDFAYDRIAVGKVMTGVFVFNCEMPIRQIIEELLVIDECTDTADWEGKVVHFPYTDQMMTANNPLIIYIDVDDTLIRSAGTKRIPVSGMIEHVRALAEQAATLYCWSSGGAAYAEEVATEFGLRECFVAFLPKPQVIIDDQEVQRWRRTIQVHPGKCPALTVERYRNAISGEVPLT